MAPEDHPPAARRRRSRALLLGLAGLLLGGTAHAASFDCEHARTRLYRIICADPELSALDEQVWNAYGERIKTLSPAQYEQVRDRHITWRRERGLYDHSVAALIDDYRLHLAWLRHPLLPLEGRYQRADGAELMIEIGAGAAGAPPAVVALGRAGALQWLPARPGLPPNALEPDDQAGSPRASTPVEQGRLRLRPNFIGTPSGALGDCGLEIRFENDHAQITTSGQCGGAFDGNYSLAAPEHPWPHWHAAAATAP
jgi:hypothetical protein